MRLAVVTNILAPYRIPLFTEMARRCDDFLVLLLADRHASRDWVAPAVSFATRTLPGIRISKPGAVDPMHLNVGAYGALRSFRPDVVLGGGFTPAHVGAMTYCRAHRKDYLCWGELILGHESEAFAPRRWLRHAMVRLSNGWIASSSDSRDAFVHYGAMSNDVLVSLMPVRNALFRQNANQARNSGETQQIRERFGTPLLFGAGRLVAQKGWPELLRSLVAVRREIPDCALVIAGVGPDRPAFEALAKSLALDNVHFVGLVDLEKLAALYAAADVFVFPSLQDPFGAVLCEAIACGTLAVASKHAAATRDFLTDENSGFIVEPRDTDAFAATLVRALRLPAESRAAMTTRAAAPLPLDDGATSAEEIVSYARRVALRRGTPEAPRAVRD